MNMHKFGFNLALLIRIIYNKCSKSCLTPQAWKEIPQDAALVEQQQQKGKIVDILFHIILQLIIIKVRLSSNQGDFMW